MFLLNILGIIIGIAAIVALISVGEGMQAYIEESFEDFGADKIIVMAGGFQGPATGLGGVSLEDDDIDLIEKVRGVKDATGMAYRQYPAKYKKDTSTVYISGIDADDAEDFFVSMSGFEFESGRYYRSGESRVGVIGSIVKTDFGDKDVKLGDKIEVKGVDIEVIGILESIGNPQDDNMILLPLDTYRDIFEEESELTMIYATVSDEKKVAKIAEDVQEELDDKYGEDVFSATTSEQLVEQISGILGIITLVLGGIASIALVVAGVGIANTMLMSVLERTREIGIMKAIGATDFQVMEIFLIESGMLGFFGGILGIILGSMMSAAIGIYGAQMAFALKPVVTPQLVIFALSFSVIAGVLSGLWPAWKAAKLQPVEALRYE